MQEQKNKKRFILLVVLTLSSLIVFWWIQPENRIDVDQDAFLVEDLSAISKVEMISAASEVSLAFDGTRWRVNGKYDADGNMVRVLFATLQQARPKRTVANLRKDSVYNQVAESGTKVSLYLGQELEKEFYVGGNESKTQAFFADPSSKEVYVMAIPGYRVYASGIFELPENGWRNRFVFDFHWVNFKSMEVEFLQTPAESFTVLMEGRILSIEGLASADTARLSTFVDDVSLLTVDEYVSKPGLTDSLRSRKPQFQLLVTDVANRTYRLRLYKTPGKQILGIVQDSDAAIFDRRKIQPLLKPKSFFRKK